MRTNRERRPPLPARPSTVAHGPRAVLAVFALASVALAAVMLPSGGQPAQAPPMVLADDAGGSSSSPGPSGSDGTLTPGPSDSESGRDLPPQHQNTEPDSGDSEAGIARFSFVAETALSLGVMAVFALLLIPGRRPPRQAGSRQDP